MTHSSHEIKTDTTSLLNCIQNHDWEEATNRLKRSPANIQEEIAANKDAISILWNDAPLNVIRLLFQAWSEAFKEENKDDRSYVEYKTIQKQWDLLDTIMDEFPYIISENDIKRAIRYEAPQTIFQGMLKLHPNAPLNDPDMIFDLIYDDKLELFQVLMKHCPDAVAAKDPYRNLTPLLAIFQLGELKLTTNWIGAILNANSNAAKDKHYDGKYPLHLAYQNEAPTEVINMIFIAYPEAEKARDNHGQTPIELANFSANQVFTPRNQVLIVEEKHTGMIKNKPSKDDYDVSSAVVVCWGDVLMKDLLQGEGISGLNAFLSEQLLARDTIFQTLLKEFLDLIGIEDKYVIQKAATLQALAADLLSHKDDTIVDFDMFNYTGYYYQQEILKLVMRMYCEVQADVTNPSIDEMEVCLDHLERRKRGEKVVESNQLHVKAFEELTTWLTSGLDDDIYSFQGPISKPLQSLFNKLFIWRGQTNVHIVGDIVWGTLFINDRATLRSIIQKIESSFPNITEKSFKQPDKFNGTVDFINYIHENLKFIPNSDVLPYRFKRNSSQKKKQEEPLWFNMNFFVTFPEFHHVGQTEIFVAYELQIGLTREISSHRETHVAYERDRILSNQPLLKNYLSRKEKMTDGDMKSCTTNDKNTIERNITSKDCSVDDIDMIEKVLMGKVALEVLVPTKEGDEIFLEEGPFFLSIDQINKGDYAKPERLCLNNRFLNYCTLLSSSSSASTSTSPNNNKERVDDGIYYSACVVAGPYKLDKTKRHFVESLIIHGMKSFSGTVGLCAHVGTNNNYMFHVACGLVDDGKIVVVDSGCNFVCLEHVCPLPVGTTAVEVIEYGKARRRDIGFEKMELKMKSYDIIL